MSLISAFERHKYFKQQNFLFRNKNNYIHEICSNKKEDREILDLKKKTIYYNTGTVRKTRQNKSGCTSKT